MTAGEPFPANRILVDEAGIESGIWGAFRLKSGYQPVFRRDGETLLPFAVEGRTLVQLDGSAVPSALFEVTREEIEGLLVTRVIRAGTGGADNDPVLTYASYRNILIISPTRSLVEAAIRRIARGDLRSPAPSFAGTDYLKLPGTWANAWINFRQVPAALGPLLGPATRKATEELASLGRDGLLGLESRSESLTLRGFTNPEVTTGALARVLSHQTARPARLWPVVSTRTAVLLHLGLPDPQPLREAARRSLPPHDSIEVSSGALLDSVVATLRDEVALCLPTSSTDQRTPTAADRLAYAYAPDPLRTVRALSRLPGGKGRVESFGGYVIRPVRIPELPRRLFGPLFTGFDPTGTQGAVALVGNYAVFGPSVQSLRALLLDLAAGQILRTAPSVMGKGQRAAALTLYVHTANAWPLIMRALQPERRVDALRNEAFFRRFPSLAFQVSHPDPSQEAFYTSLFVQHAVSGEPGPAADRAEAIAATTSVPFTHPLTSSPVLIRGGTGGPDVVIQDAGGVLHAIDAGGHEIWVDTLAGPIVEPVFRTPTGIGRPRLLLATASRLFALEAPTGHDVENFPFYLSDSLRIQHLAAFPTEGSNFTLLVDDPTGDLYAFDFQGAPIPGWQPRRFGAPLADAPRPVRVDEQDLLVVALTNGDVYALDRTGGTLPGFPVSAGAPLADRCLAVIPGSSTRSTQIAVLTPAGLLTTFNLRGETLRHRSFPHATRTARFELVPIENGTAGVPPSGEFMVARQEAGRVTLVDPTNGVTQLSRGFLTSAPKVVQAFRLGGGGGSVYALTERGPGKTYLYDERDRLLGGGPLDSSGPVALTFNPVTGEYVAWVAFGKTLRRTVFRKK